MAYKQFQTRDTSQQTALIDVRRAEVLLNCFEAPYLSTPAAMRQFVGSLYGVSNGNRTVLLLLVKAFREWQGFGNEQACAELEGLWASFDLDQPIPDPVLTLKAFCTSQPIPLPDSLVQAIFDDRSSDFTDAYLDWQRG
jgi:hypothetical protein